MGEESGMGHHAVIRPDRLAVDVPAPLQDLERVGQLERAVRERLAKLDRLHDRRRVRRRGCRPGAAPAPRA